MIFSIPDLFFAPSRSVNGLSPAEYARNLASREKPGSPIGGKGFAGVSGSVGSIDSTVSADSAGLLQNPAEIPSESPILGIAGGGLMGQSIAAAFLRSRQPVLLYDILPEAVEQAPAKIAEELARQIAGNDAVTDEIRQEARNRTESLLQTTACISGLNHCGTILETIVEKLRIKKKFYQTLDAALTAPKRLLSNTSTIKITDLAEGLESARFLTPEQFCGFHFFHPVRKRSLVEVIRGEKTSAETIQYGADLARKIEKQPICVEDGPGFLVNRLLNPYLDEAMGLLLEGIPLERIETVCRRFGMEMGPFRIMDEIGLDVTMHSGWTFFKAYPDRISAPDLLPIMTEDKRFGHKNGRGFFLYDKTGNWVGEGIPDPGLDTLLAAVSKPLLPLFYEAPEGKIPINGPEISDELLAARVFSGILFEAERILADRIITDKREADRALVYALGFPKNKGGIFFWAESLGAETIDHLSEALSPLGAKFRRSALIPPSEN